MLKRLRNRLTLLAAALTGSVVVAVCIVSFLLIREQYANSRYVAFRIAAESVYTQWTLEDRLSAPWLRSTMEANDAEILLWENGVPLDYGLVDLAQARSLRSHAPAGDGYFIHGADLCAWFELEFDYGSRQILVWQDTEPEQAYFLKIGLVFVGIALLSLAAVAGLCHLVAGRAIIPVQESMERQEQFVAAASHELRSPLTAIRTGFALLRVDAGSERHLTLMRREAERMSRLIDELLILAGGGSLRRNFRPESLEPDTLLIEFADTMMPQARRRGVRLELDLPEDALPPLRADADRVRQMLAILTDNALRYAPAGSDVTLQLRSTGKQCIFRVIDHGPGIPEGEKKRVFDRFYRGSASRSNPDHFGLGLSVALELARIHGGDVTLTDTPGGGATFGILLPIAEAP